MRALTAARTVPGNVGAGSLGAAGTPRVTGCPAVKTEQEEPRRESRPQLKRVLDAAAWASMASRTWSSVTAGGASGLGVVGERVSPARATASGPLRMATWPSVTGTPAA